MTSFQIYWLVPCIQLTLHGHQFLVEFSDFNNGKGVGELRIDLITSALCLQEAFPAFLRLQFLQYIFHYFQNLLRRSFVKFFIIAFRMAFGCFNQQSLLMFERNRNSEEETLILKNLDIMAYQERSSFKPEEQPSLAQAERQLEPMLVRDQNGERFSLTCPLSQFKKYGPGVYLIFKFMKYLLIVMALLLVFALTNMIILNDATTFNGTSRRNVLIYSLNFMVILFLTIALVYWKQNESKMVIECTKQICMPSYFTVILNTIPNHYTQHDFKDYIEEKYGKICDIYTAKNYHEDIKRYKVMYDLIQQFKEERQFYLKNKDKQSCIKLVELFLKFRHLHQIFNDNTNDQKIYEPYCVFITFDNYMQKEKLLSDQQTQKSLFSCLQNTNNIGQSDSYKKQVKFEACTMESDGVAWQNLNMTTKQMVIRCGLITILLLLFLFVSITIIFIFVAAQSDLYSDQYSDLTFEEIKSLNSTQAMLSYCVELSYHKFSSISECQPFERYYMNYFTLFLLLPLIITVLKMAFAFIMKQMVELRRHKNSFEKVEWQMVIVSLFYFIKAALIQFVIYRKFTFGSYHIQLLQLFLPILIKLKSFLPIYPQGMATFESFSGEWKAHASHKIILIAIFSFNFTILYHFCHGLVVKKYRQYKASKMLTQHRVNELLKGEQFQIEMIYAQMIALILFCMMYFSCMPIIYVLVFLSLLLVYWTSKYALINFCRKPVVYAHGINSLAVKLIFYGLILNCIVSPIYFSQLDQSQDTPHISLLDEFASFWYYLILLIFICIYLIGGNKSKRLINKIYVKLRIYFDPRYKNQSIRDQLKEISRGTGKMQSYSMHENEKYNKILEILFIMNKIEINKIGYFNHSKIKVLKEQINKKPSSFKLFDEIINDLDEEYNKLREDKEEKLDKHEKYLKMLRKIQSDTQKQVSDEHKQKQFASLMKSKIKQLNANSILRDVIEANNIQRIKSQIKSQLSQDMHMDNPLETQKRLY